MKTLGILDCDELAPELVPDYEHYARMFTYLLQPHLQEVECRRYAILNDEWPDSANECNAYLITGSKTGVYDEEPWLPCLREFIQQVFDKSIPVVGICFGHQMLAHSLGGYAGKSEKGWGIGAYTIRASQYAQDAFKGPSDLTLLYSHQDQVQELPPGARLLYANDFCPNAAYVIPGKVLAFQGHPEFTQDYSLRLMTLRQDRYAPGQYEQALTTLELPLQADWVAQTMAEFLKAANDKREQKA